MFLFNPIRLILEFYYMANGLTFEILNIILRNFYPCWDFNRKWPRAAKFQGNRFKIDGEIADNHAILVDHF